VTSRRKLNSYRRLAPLALAVLAAGGCKKESDALVVVALTASPADPTLVSATLTVGSEVKTFQLTGGLSASVPTKLGVYLPVDTTESVLVSATASDGTACSSYAGNTSKPVMVTPNQTATATITLLPGAACPPDGGGTGGGGSSGTGGSGGTGGSTGTGGGGPKTAPPSLTHCTEYIHNLDPTATCMAGNMNTDVEITDIAFSPDGKLLYSAGNDARVKVWTWDGTSLAAEGHELDTAGGFAALGVAPNNTLVAAGSQNGRLTVWNVGNAWGIAANLTGNSGDVNGVAFSPDSTIVYSVDEYSTLNIYNQTSTDPVSYVNLRATSTPFTLSAGPPASDGSYWLAIGYSDGDASLLSIDAQAYTGYEMPFTVSTALTGVYTTRFSPDGTMLEAGTKDGTFGIWALPLPGADAPGNLRQPAIAVGTDSVFGAAFDPTSTYVAIAGGLSLSTRKIGIWTVATGAPLSTVSTSLYAQRPTAVAFSPDGTALAVGEGNCGKILICTD
jgi:hypothetical protein